MNNTDPANKERSESLPEQNTLLKTTLGLIVKIGAVLLMIFLCFRIISPFTTILLWAIIIAVILHPIFIRISNSFGRRRKIAAVVLALVANAIILVPSYFLFDSLFDGLTVLTRGLRDGSFVLPPPPESIAGVEITGTRLHSAWISASENLIKTLGQYLPLFRDALERGLGILAGTGIGILQFVLSIIISVMLLIHSDTASSSVRRLFRKMAGERGDEFAVVAEKTIRNVATGVIGVALIQSTLIGAALMIMGMPMAGLWVIITLIIAIAQIPLLLVTIPMVVWVFVVKAPVAAVLWSVFLLLVGLLDNVLKPVFMGKGTSVPMLVVFLGAIGGFVAFGFLGLFLGSIILSLGYKLYLLWLND